MRACGRSAALRGVERAGGTLRLLLAVLLMRRQVGVGAALAGRDADRRAAALWQRLREVQGLMVKRWLA